MQAIATEIIVATQNVDIQKLQPQSKQSDFSFSGKSFADYLAEVNDVIAPNVSDINADRKTAEQADVKNVGQPDKSAEKTDRVPEKKASDEKNEAVKETGNSSDEKKSGKTDDSESVSANDRKNSKRTEQTESIEDKIAYLRLDLLTGKNLDENTASAASEENIEIKKLSDNLFEKTAGKDNNRRLETLVKNPDSDVKADFDFEIPDVSPESLVLDTERVNSLENPELVLNRIDAQAEIAADSRFESIQMQPQLQTKTEKTVFSEIDEKSDRTKLDKAKSKLTVTDLRTQKASDEVKVSKLDEAEPKLKVSTVINSSDSATITMDLNRSAQTMAQQDVLSLNSQAAGADGSNFQAMLNNQIQTNAAEFVKASNIILKDNGKGTINLVLHPDDLGDVKLHLSLDGNKITGHITVNTKEAMQVFKDNAQTLREAFIKSGFENAGFDVSYNSSGNGRNGEFEQHRQNMNNFYAKREYGSYDEIAVNQNMMFDNSNYSEFSINIVA